ncbi:MAG: hypothetical protein ACO3DQ_04745 [Cephaloticoccus sp.]
MVENNLRQLYQAQEFYSAETGDMGEVNLAVLVRQGYLSVAQFNRLYTHSLNSLETKMGWRYQTMFRSGSPTYAYRGTPPAVNAPPSDDLSYYPGPPADGAPPVPGLGTIPAITNPPVTAPVTAPVVAPAVSGSTPALVPPPGTTALTTGSVTDPNAGVTATSSPDAAAATTKPGTGPATTTPTTHHGPGNSDFGHSHNQGSGGSQGHGNKK